MQMMEEKWVCPVAKAQVFTPQEYVAACFTATITCNGKHGEFWASDESINHYATHDGGEHSFQIALTNQSVDPANDPVRPYTYLWQTYLPSLGGVTLTQGSWYEGESPMSDPPTGTPKTGILFQGHIPNDTERIEAHFFEEAVNNSREWVKSNHS